MTMLSMSIGLVVLGAIAMLFASRLSMMRTPLSRPFRAPSGERYQPMLRLLRDDEFAFAGNNKALRNRMKEQRYKLFREYLRCLAKDYGQLLSGIRLVMLHADVDRPDLLKMLAQNRIRFALSLCRIEISLRLYQLGIGKVDVTGLVRAVDSLRNAQMALMTPAPFAV